MEDILKELIDGLASGEYEMEIQYLAFDLPIGKTVKIDWTDQQI